MTSRTGTIYLLHFEQPYKHARHYIGWTSDLDERLSQHASGHGARLLKVIHDAGITWTLARTWSGGRTRERQLKQQGGAARRCPQCGVRPDKQREWRPADLTRVVQRFFKLIDGEWITNRSVLTYARKRLSTVIATNNLAITPADLLGWTERTKTMKLLQYTPAYVRADGSVWCMEHDTESGTENTCRMVVDLESGLSLFLPDYIVDVNAPRPTSRRQGHVWPLFRWATANDLSQMKGK